ncbi:MAG TPA: RDD family protein [Steroidobacteraceae bacterium]
MKRRQCGGSRSCLQGVETMYCIKCGALLPESANACQRCGNRAPDHDDDVAVGTLEPSQAGARAPEFARTTHKQSARYAGFWTRVGACMIDGFVYTLILIPVAVAFAFAAMPSMEPGAEPGGGIIALYYLLSWGVGWLYYALQHSSAHQATFGKRALRIKVVSLQGERISFARATGRYFAYLLASFTLGVGLIMAAFTKRRQALHDMMTGTLVVGRGATVEDVVAGLAAPKVSGAVVALAILACMIPIVGTMAAIAIPAYQDYAIRSQVTEGLMMASEVKADIAEAFSNGTPLEEIESDTIGLDVASTGGKFVKSIEVISGAVVVIYGGEANAQLTDRQLVLVSGYTDGGDVIWTCGLAAVPDGVTPSVRAHAQYTDVERKHLPSACR